MSSERRTTGGTVEAVPGAAAWRARDAEGRLVGVYPTEAAARAALAGAPPQDVEDAECSSPPCLGRFE